MYDGEEKKRPDDIFHLSRLDNKIPFNNGGGGGGVVSKLEMRITYLRCIPTYTQEYACHKETVIILLFVTYIIIITHIEIGQTIIFKYSRRPRWCRVRGTGYTTRTIRFTIQIFSSSKSGKSRFNQYRFRYNQHQIKTT